MYIGMMATNTGPGRHIMAVCDGIGLQEIWKENSKLRPIDMNEIIYKVCVDACINKNRQHGDIVILITATTTMVISPANH